jgi:SNF2 family DNA or RNA helicase
MLRRTKKDLETQLPEKIELNIHVGLSQLQTEVYT